MKTRTAAAAMRTALLVLGTFGSVQNAEAADAAVVMRITDQSLAALEPEPLPDALPGTPPKELQRSGCCPRCQGMPSQGMLSQGMLSQGMLSQGISRDPGRPAKPHRKLPGDVDRGDCPPYRYRMDDCQRAGHPHRVAKWARPSIGKHYSAWFVGGGAAIGGRGRCPDEGTWGLDYEGWLRPRRVWLNWTDGRSQGGEGAYATEGRTILFGHD